MTLLLLLAPAAVAWECIQHLDPNCGSACLWAPGNSLTYHIVPTDQAQPEAVDLLTWQADAIESAAGNWRAGSNQRLRGASWQFVHGLDQLTYDTSDMTNHVVMLENLEYEDVCPTEGCVVTSMNPFLLAPNSCTRRGFDLLVREEAVRGVNGGDIPWAEGVIQLKEERDPTDDVSFLEFSLEAVATHEFGHVLGFDHNLTVSSAMGGYGATNVGSTVSPNEEEYDVLTDIKPHSSTGHNLALSRATATIVSGGEMWNAERWDLTSLDLGEAPLAKYALCEGDAPASPGDVLDAIDALHLGTSALNEVVIEWRLKPSGVACGAVGTKLLDSRTVSTLNSGTPLSVLPDSNLVLPAGVDPGEEWFLCAVIDPADAVTETDNGDNSVASEVKIRILADPNSPFCP